MEKHNASDIGEFVNIGVGTEITIRDLAELTAEVIGFQGALAYDGSKPDGTPRKLLDVTRLSALGWRAKTDLRLGIGLAYEDYRKNQLNIQQKEQKSEGQVVG